MNLEIFCRVKLGTGLVKPEDFFRAFKNSGKCCLAYASIMIESDAFTVQVQEQMIDVYEVFPKELGLGNLAFYDDFIRAAREKGYELCPIELGPQLLLQFEGTSIYKSLPIAMEFVDFMGIPQVFCLWLNGSQKYLDGIDMFGQRQIIGWQPWLFVKKEAVKQA